VSGNHTGGGGNGRDSNGGSASSSGGSGGSGGGLYNAGIMNVAGSTISNNTTSSGGNAGLDASNHNGNPGGNGGFGAGVYNTGSLLLTNSTLSTNSAGAGGKGGDALSFTGFPVSIGRGGDGGAGGGIYNGATLTLINDTVSGNNTGTAGAGGVNSFTGAHGPAGTIGGGGGMFAAGGSSTLRNSIISGNNVPAGGAGADCFSAFTSLGHNLVGNTSDSTGFGASGDLLNVNPLLGALQDNGGSTLTHGMPPNSPATNAGDNCVLNQSCASNNLSFNLTTDERGITRPQGAAVDIGAFEFAPLAVTINQAAGQTDPAGAQPINFTVVFTQPVTGFTSGSVSLAGSTANVSAATINVTGSSNTYNVAVSNVTGSGTVVASVLAGAAMNSANQPNPASTSTDNSVTFAAPSLGVSGHVTFNNNPLAGVTVTLTKPDNSTTSTTTGANGQYAFSGLPSGSYTVAPSKLNFSFAPASLPVSLSTADVSGIDFAASSTATASGANGAILISEFRLRGPVPASPLPNDATGERDEFIELYNNSNADAVIGNYTLTISNGFTITIPTGATIPAHGHYLIANADGYSLSDYGGNGAATPDLTYNGFDLPSDAGLALLNTSNQIVDAVGFTGTPAPYFEGTVLAPVSAAGEYGYVRKQTTGTPQDTNDNAADFIFVSTDPTTPVGSNLTPQLGAPGPENLNSPTPRTSEIKSSLLAPCLGTSFAPNRERVSTSYDDTLSGTGIYTLGTLRVRRKFTNSTADSVTRLRFRIVDATMGAAASGTADLRAVSSGDEAGLTNSCTGGSTTSKRLTLEQLTAPAPPFSQPNGGGINSTVSAGSITLGTPLAPGASINVNFLLGVKQSGSFRFFIIVEALPTSSSSSPAQAGVVGTKPGVLPANEPGKGAPDGKRPPVFTKN
jgi:hypothetical protein